VGKVYNVTRQGHGHSNLANTDKYFGSSNILRIHVLLPDVRPRLRDISETTAQLNTENATFIWDQECETAFQALKEPLMSAPILVPPRDEGKYVLDTDASDTALGTVLQQEQDGQLRMVGYASRALTNAE